MKYNEWIADWKTGDEVEGFYILRAINVRFSGSNGKPYLSGTLSDCSGAVDVKFWDYSGFISEKDDGKIVKIHGTVSDFRGSLQVILEQLRLAEESDQYNASHIVESAPIDLDAEYAFIEKLTQSIEDTEYRAVALEMLRRREKSLRVLPAAKNFHHAFLGGLLMHTGNMMRMAAYIADLYSETLNRSLLLAGTLLHDLAKLEEFHLSHVGLVNEYSVEGNLLGHLFIGARETAQVAQELGISQEKSVLLQHMILSHHGKKECGAAVLPQCAESEMLYLIDLMDSRVEIYREAMGETPEGEFSKTLPALEKRIYHHS